MLHNVPENINRAGRAVVLRHPNSIDCALFRKNLLRVDEGTGAGALPTMGGMGVLGSEDESEVDWEDLGDGRVLFVDPFQQSDLVSRGDALELEVQSQTVLIEACAAPEDEGYFTPKKHDVLYLLLLNDVKIAFEIVDVMGSINIPPYTRRYLVNKRDDLHCIPGWRAASR